MIRRPFALGALVLAACGGPLAQSYSASPATPAPDVYSCVADRLKAMEYSVEMRDVADQRITGRKYDYESRRPDVQFRRVIDRLEVDVQGGGAGGESTLSVLARTFVEYTRHRGPTEEEERASERVRADAQTLVASCGG